MPVSSKTDLPPAKAISTGSGGSASGMTSLRRWENPCATPRAARRQKREYVRETILHIPRSLREEREKMPQLLEQRFLCSSRWSPWWVRLLPCSPWRWTAEQTSSCSPGGCHPLGRPCWSRTSTLWREDPMLDRSWMRKIFANVYQHAH